MGRPQHTALTLLRVTDTTHCTIVRVWVERMGAPKCRIVGKSQPVLIMIDPIISPRTCRLREAEAGASEACDRVRELELQAAQAAQAAARSTSTAVATLVSQNGYLLSRRGRSSPASASGFDTHRAPITSRFDRSSSRA